MTQRTASFNWDSEQERVSQQVQAAMEAALSLEPYNSADPMVLEVSVANRDAIWRF